MVNTAATLVMGLGKIIKQLVLMLISALMLEQLIVYDALTDIFPNWFRILFFISYLIMSVMTFILADDEKRKKLFRFYSF